MCIFLTRWRDPVWGGELSSQSSQQPNCQWRYFDLWPACVSRDDSTFALSACDRETARESQQRFYICFSSPEVQWITASPSGGVLYCSNCVTDLRAIWNYGKAIERYRSLFPHCRSSSSSFSVFWILFSAQPLSSYLVLVSFYIHSISLWLQAKQIIS